MIGPSAPAAWVPARAVEHGDPEIVGARFSSLDIELGSEWSGDIVTSTDVASVSLRTTLFEIATIRTAPGRFHFVQNVIDDPAFIVRPYTLEVTAHDADGRSSSLPVPFRIRGHGVPKLANEPA